MAQTLCYGAASSPGDGIQGFRDRQALERRAADHEAATLQEHIDTLKAMRANLSLPREAAADRKLVEALAADAEALKRVRARLERAEQVIGGAFVGYADHLRGHPQRLSGGMAEPLSRTIPLMTGDAVRTGSYDRAVLVFEDGNRFTLEPDSELTLVSHSPSETAYAFRGAGTRVEYRPAPVGGVIGRTHIRTPSLTLRPEAATFDLAMDGADRTHVILQAGRLQVAAATMDKGDTTKAWWNRARPAVPDDSGLGMERWLRLQGFQGETRIVREDGITRRVALGAELGWTDSLETAATGLAQAYLRGGDRAALKAHTRLSAVKKKGTYFYRAAKGVLYVQIQKRAEGEGVPEFRTADAVCAPRAATFEVTVSPGEASEWTFLEGDADLRSLESVPPR